MAKMTQPLYMWQLRFLAVFALACRSQLESQAEEEGALGSGALLNSDLWRSAVMEVNHKFVALGQTSPALCKLQAGGTLFAEGRLRQDSRSSHARRLIASCCSRRAAERTFRPRYSVLMKFLTRWNG